MMVTVQDVETPVTIMGRNAMGPSAKYACIPASLAKSTLCYDGVVEYPDDNYLVLFGVQDGLDVLGIELTMRLTKSKYIATSVLGLNAESPNPLGTCIYKSLGTSMLVSVESSQEYVVAIRLKRFANQTNINGDKVVIHGPLAMANPILNPLVIFAHLTGPRRSKLHVLMTKLGFASIPSATLVAHTKILSANSTIPATARPSSTSGGAGEGMK
jgi:hypothetical protein